MRDSMASTRRPSPWRASAPRAHRAAIRQVAALLSQRGALELELQGVKERRQTLAENAYYDELEGVLVRLAKLQRQIDAKQRSVEGDT